MSIYDCVSSKQVSLLEQHLRSVSCSEELGRRAALYTLSGTGADVIVEIKHQTTAARSNPHQQGLPNPEYADVHRLLTFLVGLDDAPLLVRLAHVYRASYEGLQSMNYGFGPPLWPEAPWLDGWLSRLSNHLQYPPSGGKPVIRSAQLVVMLESEGLSGALLVRPALQMKHGYRTYQDGLAQMTVQKLIPTGDYGQILAQYASLVRECLHTAATVDKDLVLELLDQTRCDPEPFRAELIEYATGESKSLRPLAQALLARIKGAVRPDLERVASERASGPRGHAFELLANFYGPDAQPFLQQFESAVLPKAARIGLESALSQVRSVTPPKTVVAAPEPVQTNVSLSAEACEALRAVVAAHNGALEDSRTIRSHLTGVQPLAEADIQKRIHALETLTMPIEDLPGIFGLGAQIVKDAANVFVDAPGVELVHVIRLLLLAGNLRTSGYLGAYYSFIPPAGEIVDRYRRRRRFSLLELAAVLRAIGIDDGSIVCSMVERAGAFLHWPSDLVAPYLLHRVDILESFLRVRPAPPWWFAADGLFRVLEHLPEVPAQLLPKLWDLATGPADGERALAKRVLSKLPDLDDRLVKALRSGNAHVRANAAHWLVDRECRAAVPEILKAFHKEKQEATKDALLVALERLGRPIDELLDRERLLADCEALVKKGVPAALAWLPLAQLPMVHWEDSGARLEPTIVTGLLVRTYKLATAKPGPLLRRYCAMFRREDRQALGQFLLNAWIAHDVGDSVPGGVPVVTMPTPIATLPPVQTLPGLLIQFAALAMTMPAPSASPPNPSTSAIKEKGILALAAACCGDAAVESVEQYLKKWYGYRAAQCRALLGILPWLDSPAATQLLLATARKFRTASIREEAENLCLELAAWKGWSMDQLGDRTIPTAGFDEGSDQTLDLGGRVLILALTPQLGVEVRTADGKSLKDFPGQLKSDDATLYAQAKQIYAETKKAVRNIVKLQTERLYEAMCVERAWPFAELQELLFDHPIAGRLCQRLMWEAISTPPRTFRPLDDQTLTDAQDAQVELDREAPVRIAYGPAKASDWLRHLGDYEMASLFPQLDRTVQQPPDAGADADALAAFEGHSVDFFTLRNLATKFGYQRGEMVDGPFFSTFTKRLNGLSLSVELEFSGMDMPGENKPVVLTELRFTRRMEQLPLAQVPRVLLSECWHDLRAIAAAGTGYDPNWQEKVPF